MIVSQLLLSQVMDPSSPTEPDASPQSTGFSPVVVVTWKLHCKLIGMDTDDLKSIFH